MSYIVSSWCPFCSWGKYVNTNLIGHNYSCGHTYKKVIIDNKGIISHEFREF